MSDNVVSLSTAEVGTILSVIGGAIAFIARYVVSINTQHTEDIKQAHKEHREELKGIYAQHNTQITAILDRQAGALERLFQGLEKINNCLSHFDATIDNLHRVIAKRETDPTTEVFHDK